MQKSGPEIEEFLPDYIKRKVNRKVEDIIDVLKSLPGGSAEVTFVDWFETLCTKLNLMVKYC